MNSKQLNWESSFYRAIEHCLVTDGHQEITIQSRITGQHDGTGYTVEYSITVTPAWVITSFEITFFLQGRQTTHKAVRHNGQWNMDGVVREEFSGCIDIDISLTPFTNSLPINRLAFQPNVPQQVVVLYLDVLANTVRPVRQQYTKKSASVYHFENVPNDFEADITVDDQGFVLHYPGLFERTADSTLRQA